MYLKNKYTTWYNNIVTAAQSRTQIITYVEVHHIVPRSLGGTDDPTNLVKLTAKEHFVCHLLLTKMVTGSSKRSMCYALWGMCNQKNKYQKRHTVSSRSYQYAKDVANQSLSEQRKGKTLEELYGYDKAQILRQNFKTRKTRSTPSPEERQDMSNRVKKASRENPWTRHFEVNKQPKVICENCNIEVDIGNYAKSHGIKCKRINKECRRCNTLFQTTKKENRMYCSAECYHVNRKS